MIQVNFSQVVNKAEKEKCKFAVIVSRYNGQWVFCRHKDRTTYECPGGHREVQEDILDTARRELYEETGAVEYELSVVGIYSVKQEEREDFGLLCRCEILEFEEIPEESEIKEIRLFKDLPTGCTYPEIQPVLLEKAYGLR